MLHQIGYIYHVLKDDYVGLEMTIPAEQNNEFQ